MRMTIKIKDKIKQIVTEKIYRRKKRNETGEIWIKSPNVTQGYLKRPELTKRVFRPDGWLRTGDFGYYDTENNWYIRDRIQVQDASEHHCDDID